MARKNIFEYVIESLPFKQVKILLGTLKTHQPDFFNKHAQQSFYVRNIIVKEQGLTIKPMHSKVKVLYEYKFALPDKLLDLAIQYDNVPAAIIATKVENISPLRILTSAPVNSKVRIWFANICAKSSVMSLTSGYEAV
jgi:hypothetical protein